MKFKKLISLALVIALSSSVWIYPAAVNAQDTSVKYGEDRMNDGGFETYKAGTAVTGYRWLPYYDQNKVFCEIITADDAADGVYEGNQAIRFVNLANDAGRGIYYYQSNFDNVEPLMPNSRAGDTYLLTGYFRTDSPSGATLAANGYAFGNGEMSVTLDSSWQKLEVYYTAKEDGEVIAPRLTTMLNTSYSNADYNKNYAELRTAIRADSNVSFVYADSISFKKVIYTEADNLTVTATDYSTDGIILPHYDYWGTKPEGASVITWQYADTADAKEWNIYKTFDSITSQTAGDAALIPGSELAGRYVRFCVTPVDSDGRRGDEKYSEAYPIEKSDNIITNPSFANNVYIWSGDWEYSSESCNSDDQSGSMSINGTAVYADESVSFEDVESVRLKAEFYAKGTGNLEVQGVDEASGEIFALTDEWQKYQYEFIIGQGQQFSISLSGGSCLVDNITVVPQIPEVYGIEIDGKYLKGNMLEISYSRSWDGADNSIVKWYVSDSADGSGKTELAQGKTLMLTEQHEGRYIFAEITPFDGDGVRGITVASDISICCELYADSLNIVSNGHKTNSVLLPGYEYHGTIAEGESVIEWLEADSLKTPVELWQKIEPMVTDTGTVPASSVTSATAAKKGLLLLSQDQRFKYVRFKITPVNADGDAGEPVYSEPTEQIVFEHNMVSNGDMSMDIYGWSAHKNAKSYVYSTDSASDDGTGSLIVDATSIGRGKPRELDGVYPTNGGSNTAVTYLSTMPRSNVAYHYGADMKLAYDEPYVAYMSILGLSDKAGGSGVGYISTTGAPEIYHDKWTTIERTDTEAQMGEEYFYLTPRTIGAPDDSTMKGSGILQIDNVFMYAVLPHADNITVKGNPKVGSTITASYDFVKVFENGIESGSTVKWECAEYPWGPWTELNTEVSADGTYPLNITEALSGRYLRFYVQPKDALGNLGIAMWTPQELFVEPADEYSYEVSGALTAENEVNISASFKNVQLIDRDITVIAAVYKLVGGKEKMTAVSFAEKHVKAGEKIQTEFSLTPAEDGGTMKVFFMEGHGFDKLKPLGQPYSSGADVSDGGAMVLVDNDNCAAAVKNTTTVPNSLYAVTVVKSDTDLADINVNNISEKLEYFGQGISGSNGGMSLSFSIDGAQNGSSYTAAVVQQNGDRLSEQQFIYYGKETADKIADAVKNATAEQLASYLEGESLIDGSINLVEVLDIDTTYYRMVENKNTVLGAVAGKDYSGNTVSVRTELEKLSKERYEYEEWVRSITSFAAELGNADTDTYAQVLERYNYLFDMELDNEYGFDLALSSANRQKYDTAMLTALKAELTGTPEDISDGVIRVFAQQAALQAVNYGAWEQGGAILAEHAKVLGIELSGDYSRLDDKNSLYKSIYSENFASVEEFAEYFNSKVSELLKSNNSTSGSNSGGNGGGSGSSGGKSTGSMAIAAPRPQSIIQQSGDAMFNDITADHWAYNAVMLCKAKNIIRGYTDGSFRPDNNITRAEFLTILLTALGIDIDNSKCDFTDVNDGDWFYNTVAAAVSAGIAKGYNNNEFRPDSKITREDMCVFTLRAVSYVEKEPDSKINTAYTDSGAFADYAAESISKLSAAGIVNGTGDGRFEPKGYVTRAMAAKLAYELVSKL